MSDEIGREVCERLAYDMEAVQYADAKPAVPLLEGLDQEDTLSDRRRGLLALAQANRK
jgi:hypothetical protein